MEDSATLILNAQDAQLSDDSAYFQDNSIKGWDSTTTLIQWDVNLPSAGRLNVDLGLSNDEDNIGSSIKVIIGNIVIVGQTIFSGGWEKAAPMPMGFVQIRQAGLYTVTVQAQGIAGAYAGELRYIQLSGPAVVGAKQDLIPFRADSVHLSYGIECISIFSNTVNVVQSYPGTSFVACGCNDGYFALQHLDFEGHKQVMLCMWDAYRGNGNDADIAPYHHRVHLLEKAPEVTVKRFGRNGTGSTAFFPYAWQKGENYHFAIEATLTEESTHITAYFFVNESNHWMKVAVYKVIDEHQYMLTGIHSSIEDWKGNYGRHERKAVFGPAWYYNAGEWKQIMAPTFTQNDDLRNTNAGIIALEKWFLATGGRIEQYCRPGNKIHGIKSSKLPSILNKLAH